MKYSTPRIAFAALLIMSLFVGCKKPDESIPTRFGTLWIHMHTNIGNTEIALGQTYPTTTLTHSNISIISARYYLSNFMMTDTAGKVVNVAGTVLVQAGTEIYSVGQVPIGTYKNISFNVGLSSFVNHSNPTQYSAGDPLAPQSPAMHFAIADSGYFFVDVRGNVDTSGGGTPNAAFTCQTGTDAAIGYIDMPDHRTSFGSAFVVSENQPQYVHMIADFDVFFHSVDLAHNLTINPTTTPAVTTYIKDNVGVGMFRYEE